MSVEKSLSSSSKVQVLRVLSDSSSAFSPRELERETTKNISVIYDAIRDLEEEGIIVSVKANGKTNYYRLNKASSVGNMIKQLFQAESEDYSLEDVPAHLQNIIFDVKNRLRQIEGLKMAILFGSVARGDFTPESDVDLYVVLDDKSAEEEDRIYDVLESYEKGFSVITRDLDGFKADFVDELSELGKSILVEGYSVLFDNVRGSLEEDEKNFLYDSSVLADWESKDAGLEEFARSISNYIESTGEVENLKFDIEAMKRDKK